MRNQGRLNASDATMEAVQAAGVLEPLCALCASGRSMHDATQLMSILDVADSMLVWSGERKLQPPLRDAELLRRRPSLREEMERGSALEALEALQVHSNHLVYKRACEIICKHWAVDDTEVVVEGVEQANQGETENVFMLK